ncbi:hypothetical protein PpBr36_07843 [Pyricularia pennisetigena]|uniref:hypothetical protein n=1 Tax=Pyricularia pennisetigena TaxID=1578925 RepID=UPI001152C77B|nr:hypothetical protein PpBr36_07843 [Pyricularia pennisetigena]TLS26090.1 hypothetical protein PpBr36_07843 [Pyricularia pennisetigena]
MSIPAQIRATFHMMLHGQHSAEYLKEPENFRSFEMQQETLAVGGHAVRERPEMDPPEWLPSIVETRLRSQFQGCFLRNLQRAGDKMME